MRGNIYCLFMKKLYKRSLLILVFFMALFLNHLFSYYTYMIFLMIIFVILQCMLIGLSILRVIWLLICDKSLSWFLNLKMTNKTMRTGAGSISLISILGTLNLLNMIIKTTLLLLTWKWICLSLMKKVLNYQRFIWQCQALTNQIFSVVRSHTHVLNYFVW